MPHDIDPERKQEIKKMIRKRAEKFANMKALPSTISGRHRLSNQMSLMGQPLSSPTDWPGIFGMSSLRRKNLRSDEEREFFDTQLQQQRQSSKGKLEKVLQGLLRQNANNNF